MIWDVIATKLGGPVVNGDQVNLISPHGIGGLAVIGVGVLTGILSGLMGVGGGIIMIPAMIYLMGLTQKLAQGISLAVIIPVSISGALIHAKHGNVRTDVWCPAGDRRRVRRTDRRVAGHAPSGRYPAGGIRRYS